MMVMVMVTAHPAIRVATAATAAGSGGFGGSGSRRCGRRCALYGEWGIGYRVYV
jgi:hypothetical protein